MRRTFLFGLVLVPLLTAAKLPPVKAAKIANAIYRAEGGAKAKVPYGVLSVPVQGSAQARQVCLRTVNRTWQRWDKAGRPGTFIGYLGDRYCPKAVGKKANQNWKRNVRRAVRRA